MKKPNQRLLYLLPLLLTVALIVFGEALGDLWKEDVKAVFQQNKWLLLAFVLLLALVGFLWERQQRSEKPAAEEVDKDQYDEAFVQFRKNLLEQYQIRLNSKTGRRLPVNLTAKSTHFGVAPERVEAYFKDKELTIESENIASEMDKILKKFDRLLLIGDPGAGKTTILLYAAINILNDASEPKLPLILNLATWNNLRDVNSENLEVEFEEIKDDVDGENLEVEFEEIKDDVDGENLEVEFEEVNYYAVSYTPNFEDPIFEEWYTQNIAHTYNLSPVFVQELLRRNAVVPFFDGFDEVAEEYRDDCFRNLAAYFGDQSGRQLIVSSRKKEYAAAQADAPVYAEIEVQPLTLAQIKKALSENAQSQAADRALLHALEHDRWLAEAVEMPFYLNTASFLFGKGQRMLADFPFKADSTEGRQAELVEIFVAEQVPGKKDKKHLYFLAEKMREENFLVFELLSMQPRWCTSVWYRIVWGLIYGLLGSLWGIIVGILLCGLLEGFVPVWVVIWVAAIVCSFVGVLLSVDSEISTNIQIWSWNKLKKKWEEALWRGLIIAGLSYLSLSGDVKINMSKDWAWPSFLSFILTLAVFLLFLPSVVLSKINIINYLLYISNPYQRFWVLIRNSFWIFLLFILVILFVSLFELRGYPEATWIQNRSIWFYLFTCLFILLILLHSRLPQHFLLRLVLYLEGKMPLRVVTFMDRMSEQHIFEDNRRTNKKGRKMRGATWRFRHKILQDYFARMGEVSSFEARKRACPDISSG